MSAATAPPVVLSIAGTDSGGAAGLAADLTTFASVGVHGACVVTAVTAQDTTGVHAIHATPLDIVSAQLDAVLGDLPVAAVKTGMLGTAAVVRLVAERCGHLPLVVDPVLVATSGAVLGDAEVVRAYREYLLPVATVITPNLEEAHALAAVSAYCPESAVRLAALLAEHGPATVVTGGDPHGAGLCTDWVARRNEPPVPCAHPSVATDNDHGSGCTFSAALAAQLALGRTLEEAVACAADFTLACLRTSAHWELGRGRGPIAHVVRPA